MRTWMKGVTAVAAALITTAGGAVGPANATPRPSLTTRIRAEVDRYLQARGTPEHVSAVSVRVTYPGKRPAVDVAVGTSAGSLWQIGSNTKAFTSVVLLQLEAEGRLSIDDRVGRWLPQYPAWRETTIRQLLTMTSGIPNYENQPVLGDRIQRDPARRFTAAELLATVEDLPLGPTTWRYSNTNYLLAQLIIEKAARDSYFQQVTRRILTPLGMRDTCFGPETCTPGVARRIPDGYSMQSDLPVLLGRPVPPLAVSWGQGAGGLISSLRDLTTWERALYSGRLLPSRQQRELVSLVSTSSGLPISAVTPDETSGFGLGVAQNFNADLGAFWAYEGGTLGFRVLHLYLPEKGLLLAVAVNSAVDDDQDELPDLAGALVKTLSS